MAEVQYTQAGRRLAVNTPLGTDALLLVGFEGEEEISRPFRFELECLSVEDELDPRQIVGKAVSFHVMDEDNIPRHFSGVAYGFSYLGRNDRLSVYRVEVVPRLSLLEHRHDCRIFQNKTVEEIVSEVFTKAGFHDFKFELQRSLATREYCVQYRETDLAFVSRLLEEEGIFYFFEHEESKHTLVLADSRDAYRELAEHAEREVSMGSTLSGLQRTDQILSWEHRHQVCTGKWTSRDFDFKKPSSDLTADTSTTVDLDGIDRLEEYHYPGIYLETSDGDGRVRDRLESREAVFDLVRATSMCRTYSPGFWFRVSDHHRDGEVGREFTIRRVHHKASLPGAYLTGARTERFDYTNEFEAFPRTIDYRPPLRVPRPRLYGTQTAMVVGPAGEEIYTDEYGRVKVQFHWDREGGRDENSSCWIRVSHSFAGSGFGSIILPRIGQEVIIDFEEGDADRPIIVGRVYNAESMPPYGLPGSKTISTLKTRSTPGGGAGNFNEIKMEDKKGSELFYVQAEKDRQVLVKNNNSETIGNDESISVGHDRTKSIANNETTTVGVDRTEVVGSNETITIGANRTETVGSNETITVGANRTEQVGSNETVTIGMLRTHTVGINDMLNVGAAQEVSIGGMQALTVGLARVTNVGDNDSLTVGSGLVIDAGDQITIKTGSASITMKKDGTIAIKGKNITIQGSGKIAVKASSDVTIKGSKIAQN